MAKLWLAGEEVLASVRDLIGRFHPDLVSVDDEIVVLFKEKGTEVGDAVQAGKTSKAPALLAVLAEKPYKFIITLAADVWKDLNDKERLALLDHHLCACRAEDQADGSVKTWVAPPDVSFFKAEIERHGMWRTTGAPPTPNLLRQLFGEEEDEDTAAATSTVKKRTAPQAAPDPDTVH